jgi:hypothetical protein
LLDVPQRLAEAIAVGRKRVAQRAIEPPPRAHGARRLGLEISPAVLVEADDGIHLDSHGLVEVDADALENFNELGVRTDAGAPAGQILGVAFEHRHVPAGVTQEICGQQSAERAADHQDASSCHAFNSLAGSGHRP